MCIGVEERVDINLGGSVVSVFKRDAELKQGLMHEVLIIVQFAFQVQNLIFRICKGRLNLMEIILPANRIGYDLVSQPVERQVGNPHGKKNQEEAGYTKQHNGQIGFCKHRVNLFVQGVVG